MIVPIVVTRFCRHRCGVPNPHHQRLDRNRLHRRSRLFLKNNDDPDGVRMPNQRHQQLPNGQGGGGLKIKPNFRILKRFLHSSIHMFKHRDID